MARPPVRRMGKPAARAASITRADSATKSVNGSPFWGVMNVVSRPRTLATHELKPFDAVVLEVDERAVNAAEVIARSRVEADRRPDGLCSSRLMDVPVQADYRLIPLDDRPHRR